MKDQRNRDLAKIHVAIKQLCMDRETYEQMLWTLCRVRSSKQLDSHGRSKILQHLTTLGFRSKNPNKKSYPGRPKNTDQDAQLKKIEALLADMKLPWSYADALAQQMHGINKVAWLREVEHKQSVIVALSKRQESRKEK